MLEMIENPMNPIFAAYNQYAGSGLYMVFLYLSLIYISVTERSQGRKNLLFYYPILVATVIFNPFLGHVIISIIEAQVYWRMFWILPITIVIAYVAASFISNISKRTEKIFVACALVAVLIMGGKFIYTSTNFSPADNWYKLPTQTIEVCEILRKDCDGIIRVVVPDEFTVSLRQYDADIQMVYGRTGVDNTGNRNASFDLYGLTLETVLNEDLMSKEMREFDCNYLVLNKGTVISAQFEDYGYQLVSSTDFYDVYRFDAEEMNLGNL